MQGRDFTPSWADAHAGRRFGDGLVNVRATEGETMRKPRKSRAKARPSPIRAASLHQSALQALRLAQAYRRMPGEFYWFARIEIGFARFYRAKAEAAGWTLP